MSRGDAKPGREIISGPDPGSAQPLQQFSNKAGLSDEQQKATRLLPRNSFPLSTVKRASRG
jgi:hypothetical protein